MQSTLVYFLYSEDVTMSAFVRVLFLLFKSSNLSKMGWFAAYGSYRRND